MTAAELDILKRILNGMSSKEVAVVADRSVYTIEDHIRTLLKKFEARSRPQLLGLAVLSGLLNASDLAPDPHANGYGGVGVTTMSTSRTFERL